MWRLAIILILIVALILSKKYREGFDNTGALMQLSATHVATEGEVKEAAKERQREIEHDLIDMTGSY